MATKTKNKKGRKKTRPDTSEISAVASEDLFSVFLGNVLPNPDQVVNLESRGKGLQLYEEMEDKDGHIATVIQTRKLAVIGCEWIVEPASDSAEDKRRADFVEEVFQKMSFDKVRLSQLDALMKGFAVSEIMWEVSEGQIWIETFKHRKPWRFVYDREHQLRMITENDLIEGEPVPMDKFWIYTFGERYENPYGKPLGQKLFWPYWFKKNNLKWWAIFNEKFGSPTPVGKYPPGTKKDKQELLLSAIKSIQQETGIVIPDDMAIEFMEAQRKGSFDTYKGFLSWCEELQSKIVLGQTLTTQQGDVGARSLGEVHDEVRKDIVKADADALMESLNAGPVRQLVDFNFPHTGEYPKVWIRTEEEKDLKPLAERDKLISEMGFDLDEQYIQDTYGVEVTRTEKQNFPSSSQAGKSLLPGTRGEFAESDHQDNLDPFVSRLLKEASQDKLIEPVQKLLDESESMEEFRDRLIDTFKEMDAASLGNTIQQAMQAAELTGRFEALPEEGKRIMAAAFKKLPFQEASDFLREKVNLPTRTWRDLQKGMHSRAFVVAGAMKSELLSDLHQSVQKGIDQGTTLQEFRKDFDGIVKKHGWSFKQDPGWRAAVIYNTNLRTAFAAGSEAQMQRTKARRPFARYIAGLSAEPRAEHLEWQGTILPLDDPWWETHTPPNDWGCKCKKVSVSRRELERNGWKVSDKAPDATTRPVRDPATGKPVEVPKGIGLSWDYNPGRAAWGQQTTKQLADKLTAGKWVDIDKRGPKDFNRPLKVPVDSPKSKTGPRARSEKDLRQVLRDAIGGEEKTFQDPFRDFVNVNQGIIDHILEKPKTRFDGREQFFPLIPEVIENPYEIWAGFARNESTGQVALRKRYVKVVHLDKQRTLGFIAEVRNGMWVGFDFFRGGPTAVNNLRKGLLVWGR